jgi:hypothetical protein
MSIQRTAANAAAKKVNNNKTMFSMRMNPEDVAKIAFMAEDEGYSFSQFMRLLVGEVIEPGNKRTFHHFIKSRINSVEV